MWGYVRLTHYVVKEILTTVKYALSLRFLNLSHQICENFT